MFKDRLKEYRIGLNLNKRTLANELNISESVYNMVENGKRKPSAEFILKLVNHSHKPEEFWFYGLNGKEYVMNREEFKNLRESIELMIRNNILNTYEDIDKKLFKSLDYDKLDLIDELLIAAIKSDIEYLLKKNHKKL